MKNVFILGARGYHENYGGWETFVSNLIDNYNDKNTKFYVSKLTDKKEDLIKINDNLIIDPICVKQKGSIKMLLYAVKSLNRAIKYIKTNKIKNPYIYILGLKLLNYLNIKRSTLKKLGAKILVNPDGLEWKRSKWGMVAKSFFLLSERFMLKACDIIVCDSLGIKDYIDETYPKLKNKNIYIAYGSNEIDFKNIDEKTILEEYKLKKNNYCLMVGRCVPENNYELIINEFMNSKINKDLVIISNLDSSNYFNIIKEKTNCLSDKRIKFINGVYDQEKLAVIRKNAYLYIHGHSVGGTNPSLIEALSITDLNILYDVNFNRYVGKNSCLYFKNNKSFTNILNNDKYLNQIKKDMGIKAKKIVKENFTWDIIVKKYKKIFK